MKKCLAIFTILCFSFSSILHSWANEIDKNTSETAKQPFSPLIHGNEVKIGNLLDFYVTETFVILENEELNKKVTQIVEKLIKVSGFQYPRYRVRIINDFSPFAASFPGYIYITTGLLDILESEDEVAAVLASTIARMHEKYQYNTFIAEWNRRKKALITSTIIAGVLFVGGLAFGVSAASAAASGAGSGTTMALQTTGAVTGYAAATALSVGEKTAYKLPEKKVLCSKMAPYLSPTCSPIIWSFWSWAAPKMITGPSSTSSVFTLFKEINEGYDNDKELKAIELAIGYVNSCGYNPNAFVSVFKKLLYLKNIYISKGYINNLLFVQPELEKRIEYVNKIINRNK